MRAMRVNQKGKISRYSGKHEIKLGIKLYKAEMRFSLGSAPEVILYTLSFNTLL